jgi:dolichol-phosphate mannosyltransferase
MRMHRGESPEGAGTVRFRPRRRDRSRPLLSVVAPVYNEVECLAALHHRLSEALREIDGEYELLFVDDGSIDGSLELLRRLADADPHVGYLSFSRNFGHEAATTAGLNRARGQTVVLIDADLQDPPELIPEMLSLWMQGNDVVYAQRSGRSGESRFTRWTSHLFYRIFQRLAATRMPLDTGDFRLMDRSVVDAFKLLGERKRFVRGLVSWTGFRQTAVQYHREARLAGATKYDFWKRLGLAFDAISGMSVQPLRWISILGLTLTLGGALGAATSLVRFGGAGLLASGVFTLAGVQLLALGLVGEYVGRIYVEVQGRPLYIVGETVEPRQSELSERLERAAG